MYSIADLEKATKLDDGWPESVEEQGLLLLVWRHNFTNNIWKMCYRQSRREVARQNSEKCKTIVCIANTFTHRRFYTQKFLHTEAFIHRSFYTEAITHKAVTHRSFYIQTLLHTDVFTHRRFYRRSAPRYFLVCGLAQVKCLSQVSPLKHDGRRKTTKRKKRAKGFSRVPLRDLWGKKFQGFLSGTSGEKKIK